MTEHTWPQVITPYAVLAGIGGLMAAYCVMWSAFSKPSTEVTVKQARKHRILGRSGGYADF